MNRQTIESRQSCAVGLIYEDVLETIIVWDALFPRSPARSDSTIQLLAEEYYDAFVESNIGRPSFIVMKKQARKTCQFFPSIKELLDMNAEYWKSPANAPAQSNCQQIAYTGDTMQKDVVDYIVRINNACMSRKLNSITAEKLVEEIVAARNDKKELIRIKSRIDDVLFGVNK